MFAQIFRELKYTFRLSVPIAVGLIGQGLFGVIDTLMVGNMLGEHALAAATLANNVNYVPQVVVVGLCSAIPVLTAQARGAGKDAAVPGVLRHGLLVCLGFSLVGAALVCAFSLFDGLAALGQPENVAADAKIFSCIIALSVPAAAPFFPPPPDARPRPPSPGRMRERRKNPFPFQDVVKKGPFG